MRLALLTFLRYVLAAFVGSGERWVSLAIAALLVSSLLEDLLFGSLRFYIGKVLAEIPVNNGLLLLI